MTEHEPFTGLEIAVIGIAGRFPGAGHIDEFWENIQNGMEAISFFSDEELEKAGIDPGIYDQPDYVRSNGGMLEGMDYFDAGFFGYTPTEAELLDPQVRLFHECAWEALENAGWNPGSFGGLIGLFGGAEDNTDWRKKVLLSNKEFTAEYTRLLLSNKDFVSARVAYKLNLKGPVYAVVTGCSTALAALHLACRSLLAGECDMALAGGVYIHPPINQGYLYEEGTLLSVDGHLRAFDAKASGTVFGSGVGMVALKPLEEALADADYIYAVIKGSAVNCDGNQKVNFTAPSIQGQAEVIKAAYRAADVDPETIGYLETHGTGTPLGDPIEINALKQAFNTNSGWKCPIGSVKSNIGHLDTAAGITGFIKAVLVLKHKQIPPSLHFETPNPVLELEKSPFYVNTQLQGFERSGAPRRVGVSSFGFGGTNVHVVLEEAPQPVIEPSLPDAEENKNDRQQQFILLSAKTETALEQITQNLVEYFKKNSRVNLADAAYTLQTGRQAWPYRRVCVCTDVDEAIRVLPTAEQGISSEDPPIIFMFSGQGSQYVNMGLEIYQREPIFREQMDRGFEILKSLTGRDFKEIVYPGPDAGSTEEMMNDAHNSGPIKFIFEYSLGKLLLHRGIRPHAVMGHSFGEYAAACLAGVFSVEDALELALLRGELMLRTAPGGMMSIPLAEDRLISYLQEHPDISLAAVNSSSLCFVSGPSLALDHLEKELEENNIECMRINFPRAAHSHMMKPVTREFADRVGEIELREPTIPFISALTGDWLSPGQVTDPMYWARHLEQPVRFCQAVEKLLDQPHCIFIQVGTDKGLPLFVSQHHGLKPGTLVINLVKHKKDIIPDMDFLFRQLGKLWLRGVKIDWQNFTAAQQRKRVPLPTYPFEGSRYWLDVNFSALVSEMLSRNRLVRRKNVHDWLYTPSWKRCPLPGETGGAEHQPIPCLIFNDTCNLGAQLAKNLEKSGQEVILVEPGEQFSAVNQQVYRMDPVQSNDYDLLFKALKTRKKIPGLIIHLWNVTGGKDPAFTPASLEKTLDLGLHCLIYMVQSLGRLGIYDDIHLEVITDNMQQVLGEEMLSPDKAAVLGAVRVIPQEYPNISCHSMDIILPPTGTPQEEQLLRQLFTLFVNRSFSSMNPVLALRGNHFWTQVYEPIALEKPQPVPSRLRQKGVYLVTGGLGGIGLVLAQYLVKTVNARLILTGRTPMPDRDQWQQWLDTHPAEHQVSQKILKVRDLEKNGGQVLVCNADVTNEQEMQEVIRCAREQFETLNGIIHTAGLVDEYGIIQNRTREDTEQILAPKVRGTVILDRVTAEMPLDFFIICSSIASVFPGFGEVGYGAANIFIDAFAHYKTLTTGIFTASVNWDTWQEVGAAVDIVKRQQQAGKTSYVQLQDAIRPAEGVEAFALILQNPNPQVVVSPKDLDRLIRQRTVKPGRQTGAEAEETGETAEKAGTAVQRKLRPRPQLSTAFVAPLNDTQEILVNIWQEYFGIQQVGIEDDFFELGGDSLMATIMAARIHKRMNTRVPLTEIFQGPTIEQLAVYIRSQGTQEEQGFTSIPLAEKKEFYPLSPAQKRLFILQQLEAGLTSYNSPDVFILEGELDPDRLNQSLNSMIRRHESLRTTFGMMAREPVQKIAAHLEAKVEYYTGSETQASTIVNEFVRPFDLNCAPLLRVGLIKLQEARHIYMFDMHHIITDGTSLEIFTHEFLALYENRSLSLLTVQYKDFSQWQNRLLESGEIKKQEQYWLKEFAGEIPLLDLPTDFPRPDVQSFAGRKIQVEINPDQTRGLNQLSRNLDVTLYMTTLAVLKVLLSRLSGQETIIIGTSTAGRQHEDLQHIIGMFVNTLVLKSDPAGDKTFAQYVQEIKTKSLAAFENQDYPFEYLVEKLNLNRKMNRNPLFDVMFSFQNFEAPPMETRPSQAPVPGKSSHPLRKETYAFEELTSRFDLTLFVMEAADTLVFKFEYCTKLFKSHTIERYGNFIREIISGILKNPDIQPGKIEMISAEEKHRLLYDLSNLEADFPGEMTVHQLFEQQVQKTPHNLALYGDSPLNTAFDSVSLTYSMLNEKSHVLAGQLQEKGVQPGVIVGIRLERSVEMIIGILAILKAGGAYLPIDPDYPAERLNYMLADSGARILVTSGSPGEGAEKIKESPGTIFIDSLREFDSPSSHLLNVSTSQSTNPAYVIYTSGTTGKPKGVIISHRNVVRLFFTGTPLFDFDSSDTWTLFHSFCFDFSVWEMYGALLFGGQLMVIPRPIARNPGKYLDALKKNCVTVLNQTPSAFYYLIDEELKHPETQLYLRYVIFGGEALKPGKLNKWKARYPGTRLINMFGITETTVHVTFKEITAKEIEADFSNIGKPIPTLNTYILAKNLRLLPLGIPGELCVSGEGVARGYLNRPELTYEKFVINVYKPDEILYLSGDLGRYVDSTGEIEYLGRIDHQVKIRGFRIELGEIESRLLQHEGIKEAVVMAEQEKSAADARSLSAYIVCDTDNPLAASQLRDYLSNLLPEYMIPSYFNQVDFIPLTANGKVDRKALKSVGVTLSTGIEFVPPGNELEKAIADAWQEILKIETIGINDNFFDVGGNSLNILLLAALLKETLGKDIPVAKLFQYPTISLLAAYLENHRLIEIEVEKENDWEGEREREEVKNRLKARRQRDL